MPRKRMIDPSIWTDEGMAELTPRQQLLYIGLFSCADDDGRLYGSPTALLLQLPTIFIDVPRSEVAVDRDAVIARMTKLTVYNVNGVEYLEFGNYRDWQTINKPTPSRLPSPLESDVTTGTLREQSGSGDGTLPLKRKEEKGKEVKGKEHTPVRGRHVYSSDFESWWVNWPKQGDTKLTAFKAWEKLTDDERVLATDGAAKWQAHYRSIENRVIPDASTWLNQARWENDPPAPGITHIPIRQSAPKGPDFAAKAIELRRLEQAGS